jgi:hypothetical protein
MNLNHVLKKLVDVGLDVVFFEKISIFFEKVFYRNFSKNRVRKFRKFQKQLSLFLSIFFEIFRNLLKNQLKFFEFFEFFFFEKWTTSRFELN